jgi:hypothetical protein
MVKTNYGIIPNSELKIIGIPNYPKIKNLTPKLAYFVGYFCADGGLKDIKRSKKVTGRYEYKLIVGDEFLIQVQILQKLFKQLFDKEVKIRTERKEKGINFYYVNPTSKSIYNLLTKSFGLPPGPKCDKIRVPKTILNSTKQIRKWFVRGVFDADGGMKVMEKPVKELSGNFVYLNMKSKNFIEQIYKLLKLDFGVKFFSPSSNGKDGCWKIGTGSKEIVNKLYKQEIFINPIKRWRLEQLVTRFAEA